MSDTPIDRDKLRSISLLKGGRTRNKVKEIKEHPETGVRAKAVTDELNNTQTYHNTGDTERIDAHVRPPTVHVKGSVS